MRFDHAMDMDRDNRELSLEDQRFRAGEQWPENIKAQREADDRPCLVINRVPQHVQQVTNDQRLNRPSIKVHPVDDQADVETAKIYQGLFRNIEYNSSADIAYDTAFESAVTGGRGYFRVLTAYVDPMSFQQEILIKRIRNPLSVAFDPNHKEPDGSDANWAFVFEDMAKEEFIAQYGESSLATADDWMSAASIAPDWIREKTCRIAEYFFREFEEKEIVLLADGRTVLKSDLPEGFPAAQIIDQRKTRVPTIRWVKTNGVDILEETEWLGKWIPIIPVIGAEVDIDGKVIYEGIVRHVKDPARMYNYWTSSETETIALAPRAPFIGAEGQFEGHEAAWQTANRRNHAFLQYKPTTVGGQLAPPPQRNAFEPPVAAITNAKLLSADDIKSTTGIYDASLGARSNEQSGIAIQRRTAQTQTGNFHFVDNLKRSIRHCGRICVDLIPKVYTSAQAARIIGENGEHEIVRLNEEFERNGERVKYDLGRGKYDVVIETGPSFATKRLEAQASMVEVSKMNPKIIDVAGDLLFKNMDWPGSSEIAERWKKTLPPNLIDDKGQNSQIPPQVQTQMQQMSQMIEQLTMHLNEANAKVENKVLELESRERIEMAKLENQATIELAKLQSKEALDLLAHQIAELDHRTQLLGMSQPFEHDLNGAGPEQALPPNENAQPTGGLAPGQFMEE